jgi:integrase
MPVVTLTTRNVPTLRARKGERTEYRDTTLPGLVLRVSPSGARAFGAVYTIDGRLRRFTIGKTPPLGLADARAKAREILAQATLGSDPQAERRALRLGETVAEVAQAWLESEDTRHWRPRTREGFETHVRLRVLPALGRLRLTEVTRGHAQAMLDSIERLVTRNRTLEVVRMLFNFALRRGLVEASPVAGLSKLRETPRTRVLTDEEIRTTIAAWDATPFATWWRMLFLTAARRDEVLGLRWSDIDTDRAVWSLLPEREKAGAHRTEGRVVPLSDAAVTVLAEQRERNMSAGLGGSPHVFPGPNGDRRGRDAPKNTLNVLRGMRPDGTTAKEPKREKVREQLIPGDIRPHDVRRTVADRLVNDLGVSAYVVDVGVLGHAKPKVFGAYAPGVPLRELRGAFETWASELDRILGKGTARRKKGGKA